MTLTAAIFVVMGSLSFLTSELKSSLASVSKQQGEASDEKEEDQQRRPHIMEVSETKSSLASETKQQGDAGDEKVEDHQRRPPAVVENTEPKKPTSANFDDGGGEDTVGLLFPEPLKLLRKNESVYKVYSHKFPDKPAYHNKECSCLNPKSKEDCKCHHEKEDATLLLPTAAEKT